MVLPRIVKPKNQRSKRYLDEKEPKIFENDKKAIFLKGTKCGEVGNRVLKDLYALRGPLGIMFQKKNSILPFEDETSLEFFADKNDSSLFVYSNHTKKRPNNLIFGRLYDGHILDMMEMGVENFKPMSSFKKTGLTYGLKSCLLFSGEAFDQDEEHQRLKSLFIDYFRGPTAENIRLQGLEHAFSFTAIDGKILVRSYRILLKKSGTKTPRVELEEMGPSMDLVLRRNKIASQDLFKRACRVPRAAKPVKRKNVSRDPFGTKKGRIHMTKQDLDKLQTRKMKGLKKRRLEKEGEGEGEGGDDDMDVEEYMDVGEQDHEDDIGDDSD